MDSPTRSEYRSVIKKDIDLNYDFKPFFVRVNAFSFLSRSKFPSVASESRQTNSPLSPWDQIEIVGTLKIIPKVVHKPEEKKIK